MMRRRRNGGESGVVCWAFWRYSRSGWDAAAAEPRWDEGGALSEGWLFKGLRISGVCKVADLIFRDGFESQDTRGFKWRG